MNWRWIETPAIDASTNMAVDQALLENSINIRQPLIRFYSWEGKPASFGYFQKFSDVLKMTQLRPLVRRPTGGGVVEHASDWTYSVIIPKSHEWWSITAEQSYERIHKWCRDSLMSIGISASLAPEKDSSGPGSCFIGAEKDDLLSGGKKIAGILIENFISGDSLRATVMGLGINVNQTAFESLPQAQSLQLITGQVYDLEPLVAQLIERLVGFFDAAVFEDPQLHARYESRLFRKGERSAFIYDGQQFEGELQGVSADGGCLIVREGQLVKYDTVLLKWLY